MKINAQTVAAKLINGEEMTVSMCGDQFLRAWFVDHGVVQYVNYNTLLKLLLNDLIDIGDRCDTILQWHTATKAIGAEHTLRTLFKVPSWMEVIPC